MSRREPLTVAGRIEAVRKQTPPPDGRRAKNAYIGKDDFAKLVGCSRSRMYAWTRKEQPGYPEPQWQERLAELSGGRFQPADFSKAGEAAAQKDRLEELAEEVAEQKEALDAAGLAHDALLQRVADLENEMRSRQPRAQSAVVASARVRRGT